MGCRVRGATDAEGGETQVTGDVQKDGGGRSPPSDLPEALRALVGHRFAGGRYRIDPERNRRVCLTTGAEPAAGGVAHPIFIHIAALAGLGTSADEICAICGFPMADGPMIAACELTLIRPLLAGRTYEVSGRIAGLVRKPSRKFGVADHLTLVVEAADADADFGQDVAGDRLSARIEMTWLLPGGGGRTWTS